MSVLKSENNKELILLCDCGCGESIHLNIAYEEDCNNYCFITYMNANFYRDQYGMLGTLHRKLRKIWFIIRNKDVCYSDFVLNEKDFEVFKTFVNQADKKDT